MNVRSTGIADIHRSRHPNAMRLSPDLAKTLSMVAQAAINAADDWWVIGSAAVALHGGNIPSVKDVDVMMSTRDAEAFLDRVDGQRGTAEPSDRFHSAVFGVWNKPPIPVEAFGGFRLANDGRWRELRFTTREAVKAGEATIFVPSAAELAEVLRAFGRAKDLERARLLRG